MFFTLYPIDCSCYPITNFFVEFYALFLNMSMHAPSLNLLLSRIAEIVKRFLFDCSWDNLIFLAR